MPGVATVAVLVHDKNPEEKIHKSYFFYFLMYNSYEIDETDDFFEKCSNIRLINANFKVMKKM